MRRRLLLAIVGVATASVVLFAIPLAIALQRELRDQELLRLQRDSIAATRGVGLPAPRGDRVEVPRSHDRLAVYDLAGRRVAGTGPEAAGGLVRVALRSGRPATAERDGQLLVAVPVIAHERTTGALVASRGTGGLDADVRSGLAILAALAIAVIALTVLAALAVSRRLTRPLDRMLARERTFTADASHQLRTPLTALRIELEAEALRGDPSPEVEHALDQVERLEATIDTLLAIARDAPHEHMELDVLALVYAAESSWRGRLAAEGRPLRVAVDGAHLRARAAPAVVQQILDVLLENALCHGEGEVTVAVRSDTDGTAIDVADRGPGVDGDPEVVFARRTGAGHGIGLALARALAQAEGGRLALSRSGPEPVFTLLLPKP
jgi:signal transduction histidine kinase